MPLYKNIQNYGLLVDNNAGDNAAVSSHAGAAGEIHVIPKTGYTDGVDDAAVITDADFVAANILSGANIFGVAGSATAAVPLTGDAAVTDVLATKTFYNTDQNTKETGTMTNNGANNVEVTDVDGTVIPAGYYNGTGSAVLSAAEAAKVIAGNIRSTITLLGVAGNANVVNTSSGTAAAGDILATKVAWVDGSELTGTMTNNGANNVEVTDVDGTLIPVGYYDGTGSAVLSAAEAAKVVTGNIKSGITLLGVAGAANVVDTTSGDAVAGEILTGKKAWVDGSEVTGTMADKEGDNACSSSSVDGTTLKLVAPTGFYDGTDTVTITDADFAAANIKDTVNIFGIVGTYDAGGSVLTGDAAIGEVLAGKTFYSNDPDTKLTGTMANNAGDVAAVSSHAGAAGEIHVVPAAGYTDGVNDASVITDAQFIAANIADGVDIFGVTGTLVGSSVLTGDAVIGDVLATKTFYSDDPDTKLTGTMTNNGANNVEVTDVDGTVIPAGYYNGSGSAVLSAAEAAKVVTGNIKSGITLLGVAGNANVVDTSTGDAAATDIYKGHKAWVDGSEITGTLGTDSYTSSLLHLNGANNGTTFTDVTGKTWTVGGDAKTVTYAGFYNGSAASFDGTGDYLLTDAHTDFNFGTGDFTIDFWINPASVTGTHSLFCQSDADNTNYLICFLDGNKAAFYAGLSGTAKAYYTVSTFVIAINTFYHLAFVRNASNFYIFINGISVSLTTSIGISTNAMPTGSAMLGVRKYTGTEDIHYSGYMSEFRVSKGIARWTANFCPGASYLYHA